MKSYRSSEQGFQEFLEELAGDPIINDAFDSDFLASLQGGLRTKAEDLLVEALAKRDDRAIWPLRAMRSERGYAVMERALKERYPKQVRDPAIALWLDKKYPPAWQALAWILRHEISSVSEGIILREVLCSERIWRNLRWVFWIISKSDNSVNRVRVGLYLMRWYRVVPPDWTGNEFHDPLFGSLFRRLNADELKPDEQKQLVKELIEFARAHKGRCDTMARIHEAKPRGSGRVTRRGKLRERVGKLLHRWFDW